VRPKDAQLGCGHTESLPVNICVFGVSFEYTCDTLREDLRLFLVNQIFTLNLKE